MKPDFGEGYFLLSRLVDEIREYAIILMDTEGTIQNWNQGAQRIKGYRPDQIIGKNFRIFYTADDQTAGKPLRLLEIAQKYGQAYDEGWRVRADGSSFWGSVTITAIHDEQGRILGFGKVTRDLTDKLAEEKSKLQYLKELETKNKDLEQFAYAAAHDLQGPLVSINSIANLLQKEYIPQLDENAVAYMNFLSSAASRMQKLLKGLLDYSRIGKDKQPAQVQIGEIVGKVCADLKPLLKENNATILFDNLPCLWGYADELQLLFHHLLTNAIKFGKKQTAPEVTVTAMEEKEAWIITVKDNGIGIEENNLEKIFHIFKILHNRGTYEGEGIGLALCKKIADLHGGNIWAESVFGEGSSFKIRIRKIPQK